MKSKIINTNQLELPLFPKIKRGQKVKITGWDSLGEYNFTNKVGIVFSVANNGIWVRFQTSPTPPKEGLNLSCPSPLGRLGGVEILSSKSSIDFIIFNLGDSIRFNKKRYREEVVFFFLVILMAITIPSNSLRKTNKIIEGLRILTWQYYKSSYKPADNSERLSGLDLYEAFKTEWETNEVHKMDYPKIDKFIKTLGYTEDELNEIVDEYRENKSSYSNGQESTRSQANSTHRERQDDKPAF